jgi:hypothetical protein
LNRLNEKLELRKNKNDFDVYKRILLEIYANPVFNQLEKEEI